MIEWQEGAVCFADMQQWVYYGLSRKRDYISLCKAGNCCDTQYLTSCRDFQLNEIRIGDYIEKSELDTEQKYNDVVDVFELFGFKIADGAESCFIDLDTYGNLTICHDGIFATERVKKWCKRKLTCNQIMAIGKLKRLLGEKSAPKSAPKTTQEVSADNLKTSVDYLNECIEVQAERGKQYDSSGSGERSFDAAAKAFNALTGEKLSGSDVCLLLTCVKVVRQNSDKSRLHDDSLLDGVSYLSLWAEELNKELS